MTELAVRTSGLTKRFGSQTVVDAIDLEVPTGAVYGFLGPNGSGKTTTIRMLLALVAPTAGEVELFGEAMPAGPPAVLPAVGALVEGPAFHPYLSGRRNLHRLDAADRTADPSTARDAIDAALDRVGLLAAADKRFRAYSLGMRQRLAIAGALLTPKDLLVLDEPTNGLDPQGTREVRQLVGSLADDGTTVLVSSHLLAEVEQMCTHLGVMHVGRLVAQGASARAAVRRRHRGDRRDRPAPRRRAGDGRARPDRDPHDRLHRHRATSATWHRRRSSPRACTQASRWPGFRVGRPSLEDVFVSLTGEGFDVSG